MIKSPYSVMDIILFTIRYHNPYKNIVIAEKNIDNTIYWELLNEDIQYIVYPFFHSYTYWGITLGVERLRYTIINNYHIGIVEEDGILIISSSGCQFILDNVMIRNYPGFHGSACRFKDFLVNHMLQHQMARYFPFPPKLANHIDKSIFKIYGKKRMRKYIV